MRTPVKVERNARASSGSSHHDERSLHPIARILAVGEACLRFARAYPGRYQLMRADAGTGLPDAYAYLREACRAAIEQRVLRSELSDADALAQMLWAEVHDLIARCLVRAEQDWVPWRDLSAVARRTMQTLVCGMLREPLRCR